MNNLRVRLRRKLAADYERFITGMVAKDKPEIIENAEKIAFIRRAYHHLKNDTLLDNGYARHLVKFKNPLLVVCDQLMADNFSLNAEFAAKLEAVLHTIKDHDDLDEDYELDAEFLESGQDRGVRMC